MTDAPVRSAGDVERAIAGLYGGALDDFIRSRDALAKELRSAGERAAASHVKSLRNRLARRGRSTASRRARPSGWRRSKLQWPG